MSKWIKKGDKVVVTAGNEKGRTGVVLRKKGDRVAIQGLNIRKKHVKRQEKAQRATIIEIEVPIHISNVSLCDEEEKPIKVLVRKNDKGVKELFYLKGKEEVVLRSLQQASK